MSPDKPSSSCPNQQPMHRVHLSLLVCHGSYGPLSYHEYCGCRDSPPDIQPDEPGLTLSSWSYWNMSNCIFRYPSWNDKLSAFWVRWVRRSPEVNCWIIAPQCRCHRRSWNISHRAADRPSWVRRACNNSCFRPIVTWNHNKNIWFAYLQYNRMFKMRRFYVYTQKFPSTIWWQFLMPAVKCEWPRMKLHYLKIIATNNKHDIDRR